MIQDEYLLEICFEQSQQYHEKEFHSESIYNKNFRKAKIKSYNDEAIDFYDKEIPK